MYKNFLMWYKYKKMKSRKEKAFDWAMAEGMQVDGEWLNDEWQKMDAE